MNDTLPPKGLNTAEAVKKAQEAGYGYILRVDARPDNYHIKVLNTETNKKFEVLVNAQTGAVSQK